MRILIKETLLIHHESLCLLPSLMLFFFGSRSITYGNITVSLCKYPLSIRIVLKGFTLTVEERVYITYWKITLRKHRPYSLDSGKQMSDTGIFGWT